MCRSLASYPLGTINLIWRNTSKIFPRLLPGDKSDKTDFYVEKVREISRVANMPRDIHAYMRENLSHTCLYMYVINRELDRIATGGSLKREKWWKRRQDKMSVRKKGRAQIRPNLIIRCGRAWSSSLENPLARFANPCETRSWICYNCTNLHWHILNVNKCE